MLSVPFCNRMAASVVYIRTRPAKLKIGGLIQRVGSLDHVWVCNTDEDISKFCESCSVSSRSGSAMLMGA